MRRASRFEQIFSRPQHARTTRAERAAMDRRERARAHLERVRHGRPTERRLRRPALLVLLASLGAGAVAGAHLPLGASLENVSVQGAEHLTAMEIAEATGLERGAPLASIDSARIAERVREHAWIAEARTLRLPTGRLLVAVAERRPVAVLAGPEPRAVDRTGAPFAVARGAAYDGLLRLVAADAVPDGEPNVLLAAAIALSHRLPELGLPVPIEVAVSASGDPQGFVLRLPDVSPLVVLGWQDLEGKLEDLVRVLEASPPELASASRLDLRFQDQVILDHTPHPGGAAQAATARGSAPSSNERPSG
jgi:hypothetical protein